MKKKRCHFVVHLNAHMLSELVEIVNAASRRVAMERYLNGNTHAQLLVAESFVEQCEESRRNLLKGVISPHLDISCCDATFTSALTSHPYVTYKACELSEIVEDHPTDEDTVEMVPLDEEIDDATFARLSKLPVEKLRQKLISDYCCEETEYGQAHEADEKAQRRYYEAVCSRFESAAKYAKAIGSDSARLWLEVLCLLSPRVCLKNSYHVVFGLDLNPDSVVKAYETAERAQRALWVDDKLRKLPAAKLPRKPRR